MSNRRLWIALALVIAGSFAVLGYFGHEIYVSAPPLPAAVVTTAGATVFTGQQIEDGQNVWQSIGGQELGTVWGHGSYVAPDWSADWLHREASWLLDHWAQEGRGVPYEKLGPEDQAALRARLRDTLRPNTYDSARRAIVIPPLRAAAIATVAAHFEALFGDDPALARLRDAYAMPSDMVKSPERRRELTAFFFWTSWACVTDRPGDTVSYTNNWPPDSLVGNRPSGSLIVWTGVSIMALLAGIGALAWIFAVQRRKEERAVELPDLDPLLALSPTPSMRATLKYFWTVAALMVVQVLLGAVTAHYGVEGTSFYGIPLAKWLPYTVTRTWHLQLGIFWIATAWLATGLFVAPAVSGREPRHQRLGVNVLYGALLVIVVGSLAGEWLSVQQRLGAAASFWFGHMGYEYVDLGRFWQIVLFAGLFIWLFLMGRALWPALAKPGEHRQLLGLFFVSSLAIALFYGAGLMWGRHTNLAIAEYWRWWVVHLWVEGFFEVFATVVIAFLFTRMGLLRVSTATSGVLFSTIIFLSGGIIGTFHHLYFTGTPTAVLALGSVFSALEVVPLVLMGFEAYENLTRTRARPWVAAYRWPIYFFVAVAFWNLVGAGLFGFMINPPIALYYMQGLNTTPVHAHAALFGVYGMLGIGLMLFCLKGLAARQVWKTKLIAFAFWATNIGLVLMIVLSLLPVGLLQTVASVEHGMWYARSAEFLQQPLMDTLRWLRVIGDSVFTLGIVAIGWFVLGLRTGRAVTREQEAYERESEAPTTSAM
jgi:nitric oxide reductase subunit B